MRRVKFRKNTIFRLYLFAFAILCLCGSWFALAFQARFHARRVDALSARISEMESRLASSGSSGQSGSSVSVSAVALSPLEKKVKSERERLFFVEGHGYNKRFAYLDLEFKDGYRARYYFRPWPSRGELISLHRRIEHDAIAHFFDPGLFDDEG